MAITRNYHWAILLAALFLCVSKSFSQTHNVVGGVSIADDTLPPHPSAILEIRSVSKGVLIPEMSSAERDAIENPADGLLVFITDTTEYRGIWFYSDNQWQQIKFRKAFYPMGSIIMYDGLIDGYFDQNGRGISTSNMGGWHICNGKDGTPDLTDMFVVGIDTSRSDYERYGASVTSSDPNLQGPANTYGLTDAIMPVHKHSINEVVVSQSFSHTHELKTKSGSTTYTHAHDLEYIDGRHGRPGFEYRRMTKSKKDKEYVFDDSGFGLTTETNVEKQDGTISLSFGSTGASAPAPIDNRPPYYTLVYIMRTGEPYQSFKTITNP